MTRSSSAPSAPSWLVPTIDERVLEVVERAKAVGQMSPSALRRIAKTIPLREIPSAAHVPTDIRTSNVVRVIESDHSSTPRGQQFPTVVQVLPNECEREILDVIAALGGVASAQAIADDLGCTAKSLKHGELHDMALKGMIEPVHGRGWRVKR